MTELRCLLLYPQPSSWQPEGGRQTLNGSCQQGPPESNSALIDGGSGGDALMGEDGRAIIDHQRRQLPNQCGSPPKVTRG